ncbi:MAG: hypothetical protein IPM92_15390 [Saprospiraceae bacterium]|nr:hypothetical protein [Saprospiraceae bacterium]
MNYLFLLFVILGQISCAQKSAETLDGKTFQVSSWETGKPEKQDPDVLVFAKGTFDSEGCRQYGFGPASYTTNVSKEGTNFKCTTKSPSEGEIDFEGSFAQNQIQGKFVWRKQGQADLHYEFKGSLKTN